MKDDYKLWYDEAITVSNEYGFAGMSAEGVITYQGEENRLQANRIEDLEECLRNLYKNGLKQSWTEKYEADMLTAKKLLENK